MNCHNLQCSDRRYESSRTRPPTVDEYQDYIASPKRRLSFKPGYTGFWQVSGRSEITDFDEVGQTRRCIHGWLDDLEIFRSFSRP